MQTKIEFRKRQLEKLANATLETNASGSKLAEKLFATDMWQQAHTVGLTIAGEIEVPTELISIQAKREGKKVFYPRTLPGRQMVFLPADTKKDLEMSKFGVLEPRYDAKKIQTDIDLLIVPGIAYALDSKIRLGFGGGYYDRYLKNFPGNTVSLVAPAMAYPTAQWPIDEFDVPLQNMITLTD